MSDASLVWGEGRKERLDTEKKSQTQRHTLQRGGVPWRAGTGSLPLAVRPKGYQLTSNYKEEEINVNTQNCLYSCLKDPSSCLTESKRTRPSLTTSSFLVYLCVCCM